MWVENVYRRDIAPALKKAGLQWRGWHSFRHGVGSTLHALGVDIKLISEILRHSETKVTLDLYVRPSAENTRKALAKMDAALTRANKRARRA